MNATEQPSGSPYGLVRSLLAKAVEMHGLKRGLARAADLLGVSERWAKGAHYGEPVRVSAETYIRALEARQAMALERAARLRAELAEIEREDALYDARTERLASGFVCMDGAR